MFRKLGFSLPCFVIDKAQADEYINIITTKLNRYMIYDMIFIDNECIINI